MGPEKEVTRDGKPVSFVKQPTPSLALWLNGTKEETGQNNEPTQNISATETQTDQP